MKKSLKNGMNELHLYPRAGYLEGVKKMIEEEGIDVSEHDEDGRIPLHYASGNGHLSDIE